MAADDFPDILGQVHTFMCSETGRLAVRDALARRRLPGYLDVEVEEAVLGEAMRFVKNGGTITSPAGWCRARITARAIDLVRGMVSERRRWGVRVPFDENDREINDLEDGGVSWFPDETDSIDALRRGILGAEEEDAAVAGALTFVSIVGEEAQILDHCPRPSTGANQEEAAIWAVLWYLGLRDCFGAGNTAAKRRSRAARSVRKLLRNWGDGRR